jgi:hypothetical protein
VRKSRIGIGGLVLAVLCMAFIPAYSAQASTRVSTSTVTRQFANSRAADDRDAITVNAGRLDGTDGCSSGAVCMYTDWDWFWDNPESSWTVYGCYNLSDETGDRYVFNNQYGGNTATLWTGANCTGSPTTISDGKNWEGDITPINSISVDSSS